MDRSVCESDDEFQVAFDKKRIVYDSHSIPDFSDRHMTQRIPTLTITSNIYVWFTNPAFPFKAFEVRAKCEWPWRGTSFYTMCSFDKKFWFSISEHTFQNSKNTINKHLCKWGTDHFRDFWVNTTGFSLTGMLLWVCSRRLKFCRFGIWLPYKGTCLSHTLILQEWCERIFFSSFAWKILFAAQLTRIHTDTHTPLKRAMPFSCLANHSSCTILLNGFSRPGYVCKTVECKTNSQPVKTHSWTERWQAGGAQLLPWGPLCFFFYKSTVLSVL